MKRTITLFAFMFFSFSAFGRAPHNGEIISKSDSTAVQKRIIAWTDSLSNRNFSEDMATLRVKAEQLGNKTKETIEEHTPTIKELMQSVADYLKR